MPESLAITRFLNAVLGPAVAALMKLVGVHPADPAAPINDAFALELLVAAGLIVFFVIVRLTLSAERPNPAQQLAEMVNGFTGSLGDQIIGHGYEKYQAWVTVIFLFVLINNLIGVLPGIKAPTSNPYVPLGLAVPTFLYYNFQGVRANGVLGYAKQFCGPVWWMAWLLIPIELVSHFARIMSLTIRLYANMYASDMLTLGFFSLIPVGIPAIFLGLHVFVSCIQAFIFMLLSMIYLSLATSHEH
jgi:F-type H+-transporting ATPase subunit a